MDEATTLEISYKGRELVLPVKLIRWGYIYRLQVEIEGTPVFYERDEEGNWRAILESITPEQKHPETALIQCIAEEIQNSLG